MASSPQSERETSCDLLFLTNEFLPIGGGVATYSFELANALNQLGHKTVVVAARKNAQNMAFDQGLNFRVVRAEECKIGLFRHLHRFSTTLKVAAGCKPNLLLASDWRPGLVVLLVSKLLGIPFAMSAYGTEVFLAGANRFSRALASYVFQQAIVVLSISHYTKELLCEFGVDAAKVKVVTLGVDPDKWQATADEVAKMKQRYELQGKEVVLTLARLTARKGHDVTLRALPAVFAAHPNAVYVIAGKGENEANLRQLVEQLGLTQQVIFTGFVPDAEKAALYSACDVYVLLSRQEGIQVEGFGITLLEASACARPVVAGRHGGVVDAVEDGVTGLLVEPDDVDGVAEAIKSLLEDAAYARRLGENGRKQIESQANWRNVATQTLIALSDTKKRNT
jgi:phosphatidyl-myo-inositol dimannoside synthase